MSFFSKPLRVYFSSDKKLYQSLRNILGFYPNNIGLYKLAFRHSSASQLIKQGVRDSNERLEFLGDSIISAVIANYLFKKFPFKDEGFLTEMRSRMVSRNQHNNIALKLGLNTFIEKDVDRKGMPGSINGDAYEALIGAIYLDKGFDGVQNFILNRIINIHIDMNEVENKEVNFKSKFIEWIQKEKKEFRYEMVKDGSTSRDRQFELHLIVEDKVIGKAQHFSKKKAEQMAAEQACIHFKL